MKAIYTTMNLFNFDVFQKCLIAERWCPNSHLDIVRTALSRATQRSESSVPSILNRMDTSETSHSLVAQKSNNEIWLTFFNGRYIILLLGVALSVWNHFYFTKYSNIVFEFIPEVIFC
jgi:vacuolar-type H+-ATPase subunit I/STV1